MPRRHNRPTAHRMIEPEERTQRLHLALALGLEVAARNRTMRPVPSRPLVCSEPPTLAVGVITAPSNSERRSRLRRARMDLLPGKHQCSATLTFILGKLSMVPTDTRAALATEQAAYGDLIYLQAHEGISLGMSHGGRAVASKALAWFIHAVTATSAPFLAKLDDDTIPHLPRLVSELLDVQTRAPNPGFTYYGVHVYRLWDWTAAMSGEPNAACGGHGDDGPPGRIALDSCDCLVH